MPHYILDSVAPPLPKLTTAAHHRQLYRTYKIYDGNASATVLETHSLTGAISGER